MNHQEIRELRLRLGWSLAEMARRLGCHQSLVLEWESNHSSPDAEVLRQYLGIQSFVEEQSEMTRQRPLAESMLKDEQLSQCSQEQVIEWETLTTVSEDGESEDVG